MSIEYYIILSIKGYNKTIQKIFVFYSSRNNEFGKKCMQMPVSNHSIKIKWLHALIVNKFRMKFSFCRLHKILIVRLLVNRFSNRHEVKCIELKSDLLVTIGQPVTEMWKTGYFCKASHKPEVRSKGKKTRLERIAVDDILKQFYNIFRLHRTPYSADISRRHESTYQTDDGLSIVLTKCDRLKWFRPHDESKTLPSPNAIFSQANLNNKIGIIRCQMRQHILFTNYNIECDDT